LQGISPYRLGSQEQKAQLLTTVLLHIMRGVSWGSA
jgi:hypothetical protein